MVFITKNQGKFLKVFDISQIKILFYCSLNSNFFNYFDQIKNFSSKLFVFIIQKRLKKEKKKIVSCLKKTHSPFF